MYAIDLLMAWDNYYAHQESKCENGVPLSERLTDKGSRALFARALGYTKEATMSLLTSNTRDDAMVIDPEYRFGIFCDGRRILTLVGPLIIDPTILVGDYTFGISHENAEDWLYWDIVDGKPIYRYETLADVLPRMF